MPHKRTPITKGNKFTDEHGDVWLYQKTLAFLDNNSELDCAFLFISEDLTESKLLGYFEVDHELTVQEQDDD